MLQVCMFDERECKTLEGLDGVINSTLQDLQDNGCIVKDIKITSASVRYTEHATEVSRTAMIIYERPEE